MPSVILTRVSCQTKKLDHPYSNINSIFSYISWEAHGLKNSQMRETGRQFFILPSDLKMLFYACLAKGRSVQTESFQLLLHDRYRIYLQKTITNPFTVQQETKQSFKLHRFG